MTVVAGLLAPIPGEAKEGADLRNPVRHDLVVQLQDAWRQVRREEQAEAGEPERRPDWTAVEACARTILAAHSKDLEVAALFVEASVRTAGFAGLAAGAELVCGLVQDYWPVLFPRPEEDDDRSPEEARLDMLRQVAGPDGRLLPAIRRVELFVLPDGTPFNFYDCRQSKEWTALRPEQRTQRLANLTPQHRAEREQAPGAQLWPAVQQAASAGDAAQLASLHQDLAAALANWRAAVAAIDAAAGPGAFSADELIALVEDVQRTVTEILPPPAAAPPAEQEAPVPATPDDPVHNPAVPAAQAAPAALMTREDGLRQLAEVTAFFRRTEPHSPLAYTLEEAMRRARLTWPELLAELVPDRTQRDTILTRLGIRSEPSSP